MNGTKENKVENTPLEKREKEHCENLEVEGKIYIGTTPVKEGDQGRPNSNSTPVERLKGRYILEPLRLRKGIKEDQIRTALRLKSDTRLDKMKRT